MSQFAKFCSGCGHPMVLQTLYRILAEKNLTKQAVLGLDIGCSLLAWDFLPINTFQTHHGRVVPTMVGFKMAKPESLCFSYVGDGGAYAIGLQSLIWAAKRNDPVAVLVINNSVYAMTGGQSAPTTMSGQITSTCPTGLDQDPFLGPELLHQVNKKAFIARTAVNDPKQLKSYLEQMIASQQMGNFSLLEVLSFCPTNWRTRGAETNAYLERMKGVFKLGEV